MPEPRQHPILKYLRQALGEAGGGVRDADLLRRFVEQRDEAAFELLLWRHAAMVLHVCRQVLGNVEAEEDAFQATFLVFVRKAGRINRREALGSWLYRVAFHIALKARARLKTRTPASVELDHLEAPAQPDEAEQRELRRILCEEVNRLPAKYRAPIVACFFEGKSHEEAAKQLGWPRGTVAGRLARARELLRRRLSRRGIALTMAALVSALAVRTAQAALAGLVDSVIHTARQVAAGQAIGAIVSPRVAALAEGVWQAMYWTRTKIAVVVLFVAGLGGAGMSLLATQEQEQQAKQNRAAQTLRKAVIPDPLPASEEEDRQAEASQRPELPEDAAQLARNMALSRLNLRKLTLAMHNYAETYGHLPTSAIVEKNPKAGQTQAKALLSWRVELLPYLGENELYQQFHRDEPWNSPHNLKLLNKMPSVYAPPGVKTRRPYSTFYQVFVSAAGLQDDDAAAGGGSGGGAGSMGGPGLGPMMMPPGMRGASGGMSRSRRGGAAPTGAPPGMPGGSGMPGMMPPGAGSGGAGSGPATGMTPPGAVVQPSTAASAFVKGELVRFPASIVDGTSYTILIVEAYNPVPWTKPEDLHYAEDEPLPELGGLFPNVFHAAFADGKVHTLTRKFDEQQLRYAITIGDGMNIDWSKIEARSPRRAGAERERAAAEAWQRKNDQLRKELEQVREQMRLLKEEQEVERELAGEDPRINQLKEEHVNMQAELKKLRAEIESMRKGPIQP